jgi:hypothetical protein
VAARYACARHALATAEPLYGTASPVTRWILLEQDGPWGYDAVLESRIDPATGRALKARAAELRARLLLVRRHAGTSAGRHRVHIVVSTEQGGFAERFEVTTPAELLDLDLAPLVTDEPSGGTPSGLLLLVCTNGRHDACCAEYGRPLARALASAHPEATWESSHVGGDRFAGNLVCLPEGVYYGRVGPLEAPAVAAAHRDGSIVLDHYRGRSCHPFIVQAADYFVRRDLGLVGLADLRLAGRARVAPGTERIAFALRDGREVRCDVHVAPDPEPRRLTCQAPRASHPPRYTLAGLHLDAAPEVC